MRHTADSLKQLQSLPLEAKIQMTKDRIRAWYESWTRFGIVNIDTGKKRYITYDTRQWYEPPVAENEYIDDAYHGHVYVGFSGGKDSTVLKHIVDSMYDDVPALFVNTGLEYPEIQKFAMSQPNVVTVRPEMRFDEVVKKYGYPAISKAVSHAVDIAKRNPDGNVAKNVFDPAGTGRFAFHKWAFMLDAPFDISDKCCNVMKKNPSKKFAKETGRMPILGTMAEESALRYKSWLQNGCNAFESKSPTSQPMSFWTEQDVLHYLKKYDVPYCSVYGDIVLDENPEFSGQMNAIDYPGDYAPEDKLKTTGCDRTGCIFCMFGCHLEKDPNRFQRLKETHPRQYKYCIGGGEMVDGKWLPSKEGLGLGKVLDYIGVKYK